ncbi:MAG: SpoIIE family protein phosphatase [Phycisphaerales bacterium]
MTSSTPDGAPAGPAPEVPAATGPTPFRGHPVTSAPPLSLTQFVDLATLQEIQDSFTAVTGLTATIRDREGQQVTQETDAAKRRASDRVLEQLISADADDAGRFSAPITVEGQVLGSIALEAVAGETAPAGREALRKSALALGVPGDKVDELVRAAELHCGPNKAAGIQFLYVLANSIARLCYDEYHTRQRVQELSALYEMSKALSANRDLQQVLDTATHAVADVMHAKAVAIRLTKEDNPQQLEPRAIFNLSETYLATGAINVDDSQMLREAMSGKVVYIRDMLTDPRIIFPGDAQAEGLASMLCLGIMYQGKAIGTIHLFSGEQRAFSPFEVRLVTAISQMLGTAIQNARLDAQKSQSRRVLRQLHLAASVQRRMLPGELPSVKPFDIAARYVPSFELGGDFYDVIDLDGHLGIAIGDVVGKGVAASLLMASVRASLRAYAQDVYDLDEIIARVNNALCRDTLDNEFATLWYGVIDPKSLRLTYCNAGHDPPMLLRNGKIHQLDTGGMIVGIQSDIEYEKGLFDTARGDMILFYTDGLVDSFNDKGQKFGRKRIVEAFIATQGMSATDAINHILWQVRKFTGPRQGVDDTTLIVVKVGG